MHLRTDAARKSATIVVLTLLLWAAVSISAAPPPQPDAAEIARAVETVQADPNLAPLRTIRILRWRGSSTAKKATIPSRLGWIVGLFRWLDQTARILVWGVALALGAALVVYLIRLAGRRADPISYNQTVTAPVHVRDLDIRPESLPDDIGAAARRLWESSEHRAALALLYRGMLSRFAYVHQIPIRDSTTEADCLVLSAEHLAPAKSEYATRLVCVWQRTVYGREAVQDSDVYELCDGFGAALDHSALTMFRSVA